MKTPTLTPYPKQRDAVSPFIRASEAANRYGIARSTFWLYVKQGRLPKPIHFGTRIRVWRIEELDRAFQNSPS